MGNIREFMRSARGATSIEYGLIASMMTIVAIVAGAALSGAMHDMYQHGILDKVNGAGSSSSGGVP